MPLVREIRIEEDTPQALRQRWRHVKEDNQNGPRKGRSATIQSSRCELRSIWFLVGAYAWGHYHKASRRGRNGFKVLAHGALLHGLVQFALFFYMDLLRGQSSEG